MAAAGSLACAPFSIIEQNGQAVTTVSAPVLRSCLKRTSLMREPGSWVSPAKLTMVEAKVTAACDATDGAIDGIVADHRRCRFDVAKLQCKAGDGPNCLTTPEIKSIKAILRGPLGPDGKPLTQGMPITNMSTWSGFLGMVPPPWSANADDVMKGIDPMKVRPQRGKMR